jgi:hypothetical protein
LNRGEHPDTGIDSTGLKVCGEGEWKVRKHGYGKRRTWLPDYLIQRNEAVEHINLHGSKSWKQAHGYHRRSLNEAVMFRYKTVFGSGLNARIMENQKTEVDLKCSILNKFAGTGMPDSYISN